MKSPLSTLCGAQSAYLWAVDCTNPWPRISAVLGVGVCLVAFSLPNTVVAQGNSPPSAQGNSPPAAQRNSTPAAQGNSTGTAKKKKNSPYGPPVRNPPRTVQVHVKSWTELKKNNVVMQERDYSCGAAALATIIKYHWGGKVTELELLQGIDKMLTQEEIKDRVKNGLSITDLRRLAVRKKYLSSIGTLKFEKLKESKIPLIVPIIINKFDHFVVYRGMDDKYVYIADPARGNVRTPIPEFKKQWQKNAVLVVVKRGVKPERTSVLTVRDEEKGFGQLNQVFLRDQTSTKYLPY